MTQQTFGGKTKEQWLELDKEYKELYEQGLETEASDNFRSQGAWSSLQDRCRQFAIYAETGTKFEIVLFDLEGNLIPGKWINTQYGQAYVDLNNNWYNPSNARNENTRIRNNAKKGFYEGTAMFKVHYNAQDKKAYTVTMDAEQLVEVLDNGIA